MSLLSKYLKPKKKCLSKKKMKKGKVCRGIEIGLIKAMRPAIDRVKTEHGGRPARVQVSKTYCAKLLAELLLVHRGGHVVKLEISVQKCASAAGFVVRTVVLRFVVRKTNCSVDSGARLIATKHWLTFDAVKMHVTATPVKLTLQIRRDLFSAAQLCHKANSPELTRVFAWVGPAITSLYFDSCLLPPNHFLNHFFPNFSIFFPIKFCSKNIHFFILIR